MADSTKNYLIKVIADTAELKQFKTDLDQARATAEKFGTTISQNAQVVDQKFSSGLRKVGKDLVQFDRVATTFNDKGKLITSTFDTVNGKVQDVGVTFDRIKNRVSILGQSFDGTVQPIAALGKSLTSLNAINKGFGREFGASFKKATEIIDQLPEKLSQKKLSVDGKALNVPVQQFSTIVKSADGNLQKLVQTVTTFPNGLKQIARTVTDVTNSFKKLEATPIVPPVNNLNQFGTGLKSVAKDIGSLTQAARFFTTGLSQNAKLIDLSSVAVTRNGQEVLKTTALFEDNGKKVKTVFESSGQATKKLTQSFQQLSTESKRANIDIGQLVQRAALTIPVWFALRFAITGLFGSMRDGVKDILEFDKALQKVKRNLQGTPEEITGQFNVMKKEITDFSLKTGVAVEDIAEAVKSFATIGFSFQDSLTGGLDATKLSVLLFGSASDTANAFARALKLLVKEGKGVPPVQEQIAKAFALTAELEKTNQFNINEVTESLLKFASTAKTTNLTMDETLVLLATLGTAGRAGASGGTLLSTTMNNLVTNLDKVAARFGISFNPAMDDAFGTLTKVLDAAQALAATPGGEVEVVDRLADVFGGERGTKALSGLLALNDQLKANRAIVADTAKFNKDFEDQLQAESNQAQILQNALREMGKRFVEAILGTENFVEAIKKLNAQLEASKPVIQSFGSVINSVFTDTGALVGLGILGASLINLRGILLTFPAILAKIRIGLLALSAGNVAAIAIALGIAVDVLTKNISKGIEEADKKAADFTNRLNKGIKGALSSTELSQLIIDVKDDKVKLGPGLNKDRMLKTLEDQLAKKNLEAKLNANVEITPSVIDNKSIILEEDRKEIAKQIIDLKLKELESQGALGSEILKQTELLNKQLGLYESELDKTKRRLEIEAKINEEKRLQNRLSSESIKLFEIAQTDGVDVAKQIADVLSGNTSFDTFVRRGGKALEVFKKDFEDTFKQQQAQQFFTGGRVAGLPDLVGGTRIGIREQDIQNPKTNSQISREILRDQKNAENIFSDIVTQNQTVATMNVSSLNVPGGIVTTGQQGQAVQASQVTNTSQQKSTSIDIGGISVQVQGNTPDEIAREVARVTEELVAAKLIDPNSPVNKNAKKVVLDT